MLRGFADELGAMPGTESAAHAEDPARDPVGQAAPGVPVIPPGVRERRAQYVACGLMPKAAPATASAPEAVSWLPFDVLETTQRAVDAGELAYNQAITHPLRGELRVVPGSEVATRYAGRPRARARTQRAGAASRGGARGRDAAGRHHTRGARSHPPARRHEDPDGCAKRRPAYS